MVLDNVSESHKANQRDTTWKITYQECIKDIGGGSDRVSGWQQSILSTCMNYQMTNLKELK